MDFPGAAYSQAYDNSPLTSLVVRTNVEGKQLALADCRNWRDGYSARIPSLSPASNALRYHSGADSRTKGAISIMKTRVILCLLWLAGSLAGAQNPASATKGTDTLLIALENGWNQAQLHHDSKALDGLVADTFISTDNDGTFTNKAQFLADNRDLSYAPSLMTNSEERVFLYGNAAVVAGTYHAKGLNQGKPFDHYGRFTDTWIYLNGKWMCVATHTSALKKKH